MTLGIPSGDLIVLAISFGDIVALKIPLCVTIYGHEDNTMLLGIVSGDNVY